MNASKVDQSRDKPVPDNSINTDNPKPGRRQSPGVDGEVGGEGRSPSSGSGGDGGDDSEHTRKPGKD